MSKPRLLLFAKTPIDGQVKTRLIPLMGAEAATSIHRQLCRQMIATFIDDTRWQLELWLWPHRDHPWIGDLREAFPALSTHCQYGQDLGERMHNALNSQAGPAVVIGSDCPTLTTHDVAAAFEALVHHDAVLKPAEDGGYLLLGVNQSHAGLFENISWGTERVLQQTRRRMHAMDILHHELEPGWDIDEPEDWFRYQQINARAKSWN